MNGGQIDSPPLAEKTTLKKSSLIRVKFNPLHLNSIIIICYTKTMEKFVN